MKAPRINIHLDLLEENARLMLRACEQNNIKLTGVVKGLVGDLKVIPAFIRGGIKSLGDSRIRNIKKMRESGFEEEMVLLRLPQLHEVADVVTYVDLALVSEIDTIAALNREARKRGKEQGIIVMVDVGDLREGVLPENLSAFFAKIIDLPAISIQGIGTNVGCYGAVVPSRENTQILFDLKAELESRYGIEIPFVSGGNTATSKLLFDGSLPRGINHLRVGEGILLGTDITNNTVIEGFHQNCFTLTASIIELKKKPSLPKGIIGIDGFGNRPRLEDKGIRLRAILAVGRQDIKVNGLTPLLQGARIIGASSDHLILDITDAGRGFSIGEELEFGLDYGAMLALMNSDYVYKNYV